MRTSGMRFSIRLLFAYAAAAMLVIALATQADGQARPSAPQPQPGTVTNPDMHDREANVTLLERGKDEANRNNAALKQLNEDFKRIQEIDLDMMDIFSTRSPTGYKKISADAEDIKVRANRLKDQLVLLPSVKAEKRPKEPDADKDDLKASLSRLSDSIKSFVSNPIFQRQARQQVDYQNVAKARLDLDDIIRFSSRIAKATEKLTKEPAKSSEPDPTSGSTG